ncbi:response regulator [Planobispora siamensis]|uniref:Response regulator n=1 Tax=Planobispora siamensis TaxID=936338 RepID=A0A8J3SS09_9ACTN|nr:response regulator [Planobispora siamensis]
MGVRISSGGDPDHGVEIGWWAVAQPRVLVIEDEQDVLDLLKRHLDGLGCQVQTATTGELGLTLAVNDPPDLVVLDIRLPGVDGREVTRVLRADPRTRNCRIVVTSVLDMEDLLDINADAVLPKPFRRADVKKAVDSLWEVE